MSKFRDSKFENSYFRDLQFHFSTMSLKKILIADDHALFMAGLKEILEKQGIYHIEKLNPKLKFESIDFSKYDILITDLSMPNYNGFELIEYAKSSNPRLRTILLTVYNGVGHIHRARTLGVDGYILKEDSEEVLVKALGHIDQGEFFISPRLRGKRTSLRFSQKILTLREEDVLRLQLKGKSTKEIAGILELSEETIKTHRKNILAKLRSNNFDSLQSYAKEYFTP